MPLRGLKKENQDEPAITTERIAHEFNNILMAIQGRACLILRDLQPSHPSYSQLSEIIQTVQKGARFTSQLLGYARMGKYHVGPTDINGLILSCLKKIPLPNGSIMVEKELTPTQLFCMVDKLQIRRVLMNVLENAVAAMPRGGQLTITTTSELILEDSARRQGLMPGRFVRITVTDTGVGMDDATLHGVFDPFLATGLQVNDIDEKLGLASSHGIILNHKGVIDVCSTRDTGTTFSILLPQFETPAKLDLEREINGLPKGFETILLVDDDEVLLEMGRQMLTTLGYKIITANSGALAIEIYATGKTVDMVVLDMIMEDMDGLETFRRLLIIDPDIKVLLATGHTIDSSAESMLTSGCRGFILKPFTMGAFARKLREILD
ncbi:MAG: response regulator [Desulfobacterium sp.]|jgi:CheY-like chemotaxis protein|nr:response regulator [Desulfobacterium sp.]